MLLKGVKLLNSLHARWEFLFFAIEVDVAIMLELEKRTGSSEITRIELHYGEYNNPSYSIDKLWTIFWICVFVEKRPRQNVILIE